MRLDHITESERVGPRFGRSRWYEPGAQFRLHQLATRLSASARDGHSLPDDHSESVPPDPIPNSVVKRLCADGSVGSPHVRVGRCQASPKGPTRENRASGLFLCTKSMPCLRETPSPGALAAPPLAQRFQARSEPLGTTGSRPRTRRRVGSSEPKALKLARNRSRFASRGKATLRCRAAGLPATILPAFIEIHASTPNVESAIFVRRL